MTQQRITWVLIRAALAVTCSAGVVHAQATEGLAFDVASVKPNRSGETRLSVNTEPGRFVAVNAPLVLLVRLAFAAPEYRLLNLPDWARTERFDILGTTDGPIDLARQRAMLRTLLRERFKLVVREETRELPIYALVLTTPDSLHPNLRRSSTDCVALAASRTTTPSPPSPRILCGARGRPGGVSIGGMSMNEVAEQVFSPEAGRLVVDRTGLQGPFDFDLDFARAGAPADSLPTDAVPLVTAIQEQLGLRLEPQRGPVAVVVVDSLERPAAD